MELQTYYEVWQLETYGNILCTGNNLYADEDHDDWKETIAEKEHDPFMDVTKI